MTPLSSRLRLRGRALRLPAVVAALSIGTAAVAAIDVLGAEADAQSQCQLYALTPTFEGTAIVGKGGREGCTSTRSVTVLLREDRAWRPDSTLDWDEKTGADVHLVVARICHGVNYGRKVYVETRTNTGGKVQSPRATYLCN